MGNKPIYYKGIKLGAFGLPAKDQSNKQTVNNRGGKRRREAYHPTFHSNLRRSSPKNLIVMYDIPHSQKKERDWFRRQLKSFHYIMIQRSVWVGPSPLPSSFTSYVKSIGLKDKLETFKLASSYKKKR